MITVVIILSFLFDGIFSNLITNNSLLVPIFSLVSLLVLYPYFNSNNKNFIIVSGIVGLFYDIIYTDSIFVNTFMFLLLSIFIIKISEYANYNLLNLSILTIISICLYRILSYLLLCMVGYLNFNEIILIRGIYSSLIINIIYCIILYFVTDYIGKKFKLRKSE